MKMRAPMALLVAISSTSCTKPKNTERIKAPAPIPATADAGTESGAQHGGLDDFDAATDDMFAGDDPSELHPFSPGAKYCLEMYSVCSGTPPLCTSAPLQLNCGESGKRPGSSEKVTCMCP